MTPKLPKFIKNRSPKRLFFWCVSGSQKIDIMLSMHPPKPSESAVLIKRKHCLHFSHQTQFFGDFVKNGSQKGGLGHPYFNVFGVFFWSSFPKGLQADFDCFLESPDLHNWGYSSAQNTIFTFCLQNVYLFWLLSDLQIWPNVSDENTKTTFLALFFLPFLVPKWAPKST